MGDGRLLISQVDEAGRYANATISSTHLVTGFTAFIPNRRKLSCLHSRLPRVAPWRTECSAS
jgi:hypothetical protein